MQRGHLVGGGHSGFILGLQLSQQMLIILWFMKFLVGNDPKIISDIWGKELMT
jgi:hypothetical protein